MPKDENYYEILGIAPDASTDQIKEAYIYKVNILHPDRLAGASERIRRLAEEELKKVNVAYQVLSNPERKRQYDIKQFGRTSVASNLQKTKPSGKPQPEVYPKTVSIKDALPYVKQRSVFFLRNSGGPYTKVLIGQTPGWIKIAKTAPLQEHSKLPMRVEIEATGIQWGKVYSGRIAIKLDDVETHVGVELSMAKKPR
jgi:hypothetical protein